MAEGGEEKAIFVGLRNDAQQALPDIAKQAGKFADDTADGVEKGLTAHAVNESEVTDSLQRITTGEARSALGKSVESTTADAESSTGKISDVLRRLTGESGDEGSVLDDTRQMATETPSMGWKNYNDLSPKSKSLARALDGNGVADIGPGEVGTKHLAELTRGYNGEVAVIQGPGGDLKLIRGTATATKIPDDLAQQGYKFTVHTHPEDRIPGEFTDLDKARGLRNSMEFDLESRARGTATHTEAVVNRLGDVTHFDHTGILSTTDGSLPGGPINHLGFVVPVKGL
jgi:hypothetical protein